MPRKLTEAGARPEPMGVRQPARVEDSGNEEPCDCDCGSIWRGGRRRRGAASPTAEECAVSYAATMTRTAWPRERSISVDEEAPACDCRLEAAAKMLRGGPLEIRGRRCWICPREFRARCLFFKWIDQEAPQERPRMAPPSAAAPESLIAPPAEAAVEQMLRSGTQDGVRQAVEARSLTHWPAAADRDRRGPSPQLEHRIHPGVRWYWVEL